MEARSEVEFRLVQKQRDELMDQLSDQSDQINRLAAIVGGAWEQGTAPELRAMVDRVYALSQAAHSLGRKADRVRALHKRFHAEAVTGSPGRQACCQHLFQLVNELTQAVESDLPLVVMTQEAGPPVHPAFVAAGGVERGELVRVVGKEGTALESQLLRVIADAAAELRRWHPRTELAARLYERLMAPLRAAGRATNRASPAEPVEPQAGVTPSPTELLRETERMGAEAAKLREEVAELRLDNDCKLNALNGHKETIAELREELAKLHRVTDVQGAEEDDLATENGDMGEALRRIREVANEILALPGVGDNSLGAVKVREILGFATKPEGSSTDACRVENLEAENQELREKLTELDRAYDEQKTAVTAAEELRAKLAATQQQASRLQKAVREDREELSDWAALAVKRRKSRNEALTILRNGTIRPDLAVVKAAEVLDKCSETDIGAERQLIANLAELEELKAFRDRVLQGVEEKSEYERRYAGLLSGVADVARRVGPVARPDWVREQLDGILNAQGRRGQLLEFADKAVLAENQRLGQVCGDRLDAIRELQQQIAELERLVQRQRAELAEKSQAIEQQRQGLEDAAKGREVLEQRGRADRERLHDCQQALRSAQDREELAEARVANAVGYADECLAAGGPGGKFYWNKLRMFLTLGQQPAVPAADHQKATEELIAKVKAEKERGDRLNRENDDLCGRVKRLEQEKAELLVLSADAAKKLHEARQANDHLGEKVEAQRSTIDSQAEWAQQRAARIETLEARIDAAVEQIERRDPSGAFEWCNEVKSILTGFRAN